MERNEGIDNLFLFATEGILVANERGEIVRINPSAEKLFGYQTGELVGQKIESLIPKRLTEKHVAHRENFNRNPHPRAMGAGKMLFAMKKDGSEFPVEISLSPYTTSEGKFTIGFVVDITERIVAEEKLKNYSIELERQVKNRTLILEEAIEELEKTKRDLHNALEKERELNELKSRFVSMASHEFRTPLTTMMSSLSLITKYGDQNDKENQSKHVTKIKTSIHNLTDILNDFLSITKFEEGKIENQPEQINIRLYIGEIVSDMQPTTKASQQLFYTHEGSETVVLDVQLIRNILFNLISNAIKFSPVDGKIQVHSSVTKESLVLSVMDNGVGIPDADQRHLFERFFRGNNVTHIQGTGLGLAIVARYVERMNGTIHFESQENKGTTFTLSIPQNL